MQTELVSFLAKVSFFIDSQGSKIVLAQINAVLEAERSDIICLSQVLFGFHTGLIVLILKIYNLTFLSSYSNFQNSQLIIEIGVDMKVTPLASRLSEKINWFPGHMRKALRVMNESTQYVDVFLEIRDARIPYSSRNSEFDKVIKQAQKEKVIVFNKIDISDPVKTNKIIKDYNDYGITCFGVSSQKHDDMRKIISILQQKYKSKYKQVGLWFMAFGMPNVGKSSILNQLRNISDLENKRSVSKVTASVCTTKGTKGFKIMEKPLMYLMDSPGVSVPSVIPNQLGMKLALLGIIKEQVVEKGLLLEYLYQFLERERQEKYWKTLRIDKPKNYEDFFFKVRNKYKFHNYDAACDHVIHAFRKGELGNITLDDPEDETI